MNGATGQFGSGGVAVALAMGVESTIAQLVRIRVILQEEIYTSKASFLDGDPIPTYEANAAEKLVLSGKRLARSWYRAKDGRFIHADINGSSNILRKSSSDPLQVGRGVAGAAVLPRRLAV